MVSNYRIQNDPSYGCTLWRVMKKYPWYEPLVCGAIILLSIPLPTFLPLTVYVVADLIYLVKCGHRYTWERIAVFKTEQEAIDFLDRLKTNPEIELVERNYKF